MPKVRSLVITAFDVAGRRINDSVRRALIEGGVEVFNFENITPGASWANAFTDALRAADFIVADVTRQNPNVFYELGIAHALRKPTVILMSSEGNGALPSDLAGFQYIVYDPNDLSGLVNHIKRAATGFTKRREDSQ